MLVEFADRPTLATTQTQNGPDLWRELLDQMPVGAVVAGGAVRDWYLGVPPKDIDIFFPADTQFDAVGFDSVDGDKWDPNSERAKEYAALPEIELVLRGEVAGFQVDLVFLTIPLPHPLDLLDRFDFGITRCGFHKHIIWDAPEAARDRENKTVTLLLGDRLERSRTRFDRFNERMGGDWKLVEDFE